MLALFRWPTLTPVISIGVGAMLAAASFDVWWANLCFAVAFIAVILAFVIASGKWINSKKLRQTRSEIWRRHREDQSPRWITALKIKLWEASPIIGLLFLACILGYFIHERRDIFLLSQPEGVLYPATDPTPIHRCGELKDGQIVIFTGTNVWILNSFPFTVLRIKGEDRLVVNRDQDGAIRLSLDIFDARDTLVMRMDKGVFEINRYSLWKSHRQDWNTLQINDYQGTQVFKMRYMNKQAIMVDAVLRYPGVKETVSLDGSRLVLDSVNGITFSANCFNGMRAGIDRTE